MVNIEKIGNEFKFEIKGLHKLWALKSEITIPADHIIKAYKNTEKIPGFFGLRLPGVNIPGVITAGTYWIDEGTIFCDYSNQENLIVVELADENYKRLVIEVANVDISLSLLQNK